MLIRNLKESLKTGEYDNAKLIVSTVFFTKICKKLKNHVTTVNEFDLGNKKFRFFFKILFSFFG